jgi:hypothetical protein
MGDWCGPDNSDHDWGPGRPVVASKGPMEGDWIVRSCQRCNSGLLARADGEDGIDQLLAHLEILGCDPRPVSDV